MTIRELAKGVAKGANECCERSDGYEEAIEEEARRAIETAVAEEREACARVAEANTRYLDCGVQAEIAAEIRARG